MALHLLTYYSSEWEGSVSKNETIKLSRFLMENIQRNFTISGRLIDLMLFLVELVIFINKICIYYRVHFLESAVNDTTKDLVTKTVLISDDAHSPVL